MYRFRTFYRIAVTRVIDSSVEFYKLDVLALPLPLKKKKKNKNRLPKTAPLDLLFFRHVSDGTRQGDVMYYYTDRLQFPDDQYVEDEYEHERYGEPEYERIERERGLPAEQLVLRPYDVAALDVALIHGVCVHDDRYHENNAERPRGDRHDLGHVRGAHLGRRYRMAYGYVPVRAHDHQEYAAGELVHAGGRHVHLAHDVAERPELHGHGDDQEWYADQETLVGDRQVHDVHVGHRLHLGEPDHHVDDQRVAHQADHAHDHVQDLGYQVQGRFVPGRVAAVAGAVVVRARVRAVVVRAAGGAATARQRFRGRPRGRQLHDVREFHRPEYRSVSLFIDSRRSRSSIRFT